VFKLACAAVCGFGVGLIPYATTRQEMSLRKSELIAARKDVTTWEGKALMWETSH
jgi:hypothetical protein